MFKNSLEDKRSAALLKKQSGKRFMARLNRDVEESYVSFLTADGATVKGFLAIPRNKPVTQKALLLHEIEGHKSGDNVQRVARMYARMGVATLRIDFSGHGDRKDEWTRYSPQSMLVDAKESIDWLDNKFPDVEKTILGGFSTGGAIVVMMRAIDKRVSKACLLYPVLSFKYNFLAAAYPDEELLLPIKDWDLLTGWRAYEFTKEKIESSLNLCAPFSLFIHTYGANFILGCKYLVDSGRDVQNMLAVKDAPPLTVIQGTADFCVPHAYAEVACDDARSKGSAVRFVSMQEMNHKVPKPWEHSVLYQFKKAALTETADFKPQKTVVRLASPPDFWAALSMRDPNL